MKIINNILKELSIKPISYKKNGNIYIINTDLKKYIIKKSNKDIYDYLNSRTFDYYPDTMFLDNYLVSDYEEEIIIPDEQKILDLIDLVSLLHKKTTYYNSINENDLKQIYEDIGNDINYLLKYYDILMTNIESLEFMSPKEFYLAKNISLIYYALEKCQKQLNNWYKTFKDKTNYRVSYIHNNLTLEHFINNKLISWENSKIDIPIFDIYKLYKETYDRFDWFEIYKRYNLNFPLNKFEIELFEILIMLPNKIEFTNNEYDSTLLVTKEIIYLNKTNKLIDSINNLPQD